MREEIFVLLLAVSLSVCANSYYDRTDGWYPDAWAAAGIGKDDYSIGRYDELWLWNGEWKRDEDNKNKKIDEKLDKGKLEDIKDVAKKVDDKNVLDIKNDVKIEEIKDEIKEVKDEIKEIKKGGKEDDEEKYIYYPCKYSNEEDCIRHFLSTNGQCVPVYKYNQKDRIYREKSVLYHPKFNYTVTMTDSTIEGLHGKVDKFYINKKTGNLVYSVDFKAISVDSKISYFEFHRQGQEPVLAADFVKVTYAPTVITAVIPFTYFDLSLKYSRITAYISGNPDFLVGPKITNNPDPVIQRTIAGYTADVSTAVQEAFLSEAYNFFIAYLQNYICDFGINV